jgi:hypothetical protein
MVMVYLREHVVRHKLAIWSSVLACVMDGP